MGGAYPRWKRVSWPEMSQDPPTPQSPGQPEATDPANHTRWRVMLVRLPTGSQVAITRALRRPVAAEKLPLVVRVTRSRLEAADTAERLRMLGAVVLLLEEPEAGEHGAFCNRHPMRIAARRCRSCDTPICSACTMQAKGLFLCESCDQEGKRGRRQIRIRQLFHIFLFLVFIYMVVDHIREDLESVHPAGTVPIALLQFLPTGTTSAPILRALNGPAGAGTSLLDIEPWFDREKARYGVANRRSRIQVDVRGPWALPLELPQFAEEKNALLHALSSWRYARAFRLLAEDFGVDLDAYAAQVFIIYKGSGGDIAAESRGSERGRIAIAQIDLGERNPAYAVISVAHEMAHTLGAADLYAPATSLAIHPEGFVEPFLFPLYPQRYGELMAGGDVPTDGEQEHEPTSLDQVRIGYRSAAHLNWIDDAQADLFYTPPETSTQDRLLKP